MYEGKHIHFSEVDQKPLCSYSTKLCKQRRLNGYAFCIRHVLEDKSAPFRQCEFVAKYNRLRCTNPIPGEERRKFCNSHMQVLGLAPKKTKKRKSENTSDLRNDTPSSKGESKEREKHKKKSKDKKKKKKKKKKDKHKNKGDKSNHKDGHVNSKSNIELDDLNNLCGTMAPEYLHVLPRVDGLVPHVTSVEKTSRTKSKRRKDGSTLQDRLQEKLERNKQRLRQQREKEMLAKASRHIKLDDNVSSASHISPPLSDSGLQYNASYLDTQRLFPMIPPIVAGRGRVPSISWPQLTQRAPSPQEAFVKLQQKRPRDLFARKLDSPAVDRLREQLQHEEGAGTDLFPLGLEFSDEEDAENEEVTERRHRYTYKEHYSLSCSSSTEESNTPISRNDRLKQLKTQLQRGCRKATLSLQCDRLARKHVQHSSKLLVDAAREHPFGTAVSILRVQEQTLQRPKVQSPPERICCSKEENGDPCQEESMPYSKHCFRHILEDEEQVLFYQCSAEFPGGFRCIEPSFDMLNEQPLCLEHAKRMRMQPKQKRPRKKTKPSALTRPFKKKKKNQRRKVRPQKPIPPAEPLQNYRMPISTTVPITPNPPAPAPFRSPSPLGAHDIPDHLPDHLMDISALEVEEADLNVDSPNEEMNSEAEEEALSSILPNLNDLFGGKNGDFIPTKEEAEALERALFQASEEVNEAKASLEQLQFPPESLLLDEGDCESANSLPADVTEAAISQDSSDGLPSDLQSAANRLIADTIRQNSNDATHNSIHPSSTLTNSVPLSGLSATQPVQQAFSLPNAPPVHSVYTNTVAQFNGTIIPQTQALLTQNALATNTVSLDHNHHDALRPLNPVLNGLITGNQRAMLPQFPVTQSLTSPHGQQVPHPMLSPHSPQIVTTTLPQTSPNANPGISPNPTAAAQASQPTALPSFRQTWNTLPNIHNALLRNNGNIPNMNGLNSSSQLQFGTQMVTQPMCSPKLPSFNTVVAGITQNHLQQQPFSPGLPSPQPNAAISTAPFTAPNVNSITPPIKQQGT